jgi:glucose-1-phosphate thymidylyltransferase
MNKTKGIILAGGNGSRLHPLTYGVSKQLLPVYDKPMIHYPVSLMLQADIRDILIIVSNEYYIPLFKKSLIKVSANISYIVQDAPLGLAQAFILGEEFIGDDNVCLMLGDNIFHGENFGNILKQAKGMKNFIFGVKVKNPSDYGVMKFETTDACTYLEYEKLVEVVEKPIEFVSVYAVPGIYFFDNSVATRAKQVKPSARGELEIVDVINSYIQEDAMAFDFLDNTIWFDCGTHDHLLAAGNYVQAVQQRTTQIIGDVNI